MTTTLKSRLKLGAAFASDVHGGAAIIMALMTPIIIGGLAFGAEVGGWELTKREVQNAADVAAYAAGTQARSGETNAVAEAAAENVATLSGFKGDADDLTLERPPSSAPNAADGTNPNGNSSYVYVTLTQTASRTFTKFFATSDTVSFQSAALAKIESGRPACILALHPSASGAIATGGSTTVTLTGCDIAANSVSTSAIAANGNGSSVTADCISAVGNVAVNNTYHLTCASPINNGPKTADPYATVPSPASASCTSSKTFAQFPAQGSGTMRCYTGSSGGVTVGSNVTLASNTTYVFENTGATSLDWKISGNKTVTGAGVTLVFKGKWSVKINGNTQLAISAPTSGTYKGIAIFGDRSNQVDFDNTGNSAGKIVGAVYSANKNSTITYTGSSTTYSSGQCTQVIGGKVKFWGNGNFSTNCSNSGTRSIMAGQSIKIVG